MFLPFFKYVFPPSTFACLFSTFKVQRGSNDSGRKEFDENYALNFVLPEHEMFVKQSGPGISGVETKQLKERNDQPMDSSLSFKISYKVEV